MTKHNLKKKTAAGFAYLVRNFTKKLRVTVRDRKQDSELWYIYISPLRILLAAFGVFIVLFALVVTLIVYTPVLDSLPVFPGSKTREILLDNVIKIDSLQYEMQIMQSYCDNIDIILQGGLPTTVHFGQSDSLASNKEIVPPSVADSLLRAQLENEGRYALVDGVMSQSGTVVKRMEFVKPIEGTVITKFNPTGGSFGIGVVPSSSQHVTAAQKGTVVMSQWTPEDGYTLVIQHDDNNLTFYKHNSQLLKQVGDHVETGEVISYIEPGVVDNATRPSGEFIFELWTDGVPVDPERFILFQ